MAVEMIRVPIIISKGNTVIVKTSISDSSDVTEDSGNEYDSPSSIIHNSLIERDASDAHPISAITGLEARLSAIENTLQA